MFQRPPLIVCAALASLALAALVDCWRCSLPWHHVPAQALVAFAMIAEIWDQAATARQDAQQAQERDDDGMGEESQGRPVDASERTLGDE